MMPPCRPFPSIPPTRVDAHHTRFNQASIPLKSDGGKIGGLEPQQQQQQSDAATATGLPFKHGAPPPCPLCVRRRLRRPCVCLPAANAPSQHRGQQREQQQNKSAIGGGGLSSPPSSVGAPAGGWRQRMHASKGRCIRFGRFTIHSPTLSILPHSSTAAGRGSPCRRWRGGSGQRRRKKSGRLWGHSGGRRGRPRVGNLSSSIDRRSNHHGSYATFTHTCPAAALLPTVAAAASALLSGAKPAHAYRDLRMSPETRVVAAGE